MWVKYNKYISTVDGFSRWIHPDFATNESMIEKYQHHTDRTLFLCKTSISDLSGYESFNVVEVTDIVSEKKEFRIGFMLTKYEFRKRFTFEEKVKLDNFSSVINGNQSLTSEQKEYQKSIMTTITKDFESALDIDISIQETISAINFFKEIGVLTKERVNEILSCEA